MDIQFKKGILIVLVAVNRKDMYSYKLISTVSKVVDINVGTVYSLLKRLTNEKYFNTYLKESNEVLVWKYYKITNLGRAGKDELVNYWKFFSKAVNKFIKEGVIND